MESLRDEGNGFILDIRFFSARGRDRRSPGFLGPGPPRPQPLISGSLRDGAAQVSTSPGRPLARSTRGSNCSTLRLEGLRVFGPFSPLGSPGFRKRLELWASDRGGDTLVATRTRDWFFFLVKKSSSSYFQLKTKNMVPNTFYGHRLQLFIAWHPLPREYRRFVAIRSGPLLFATDSRRLPLVG